MILNFKSDVSTSGYWLFQIKLSGVIAQSSTYTQWKKPVTISLIIHKPSTHSELQNPTRRSGVELTTPPLSLHPTPPTIWVTRGNFLTCLLGRHGQHVWLIIRQLPIKAGNKIKPGTHKVRFQPALNKTFRLKPPPPTHQQLKYSKLLR